MPSSLKYGVNVMQSSIRRQRECGWEACIQTIQHQCLQIKYKQNNGEHPSLKQLYFSSLTMCIWFPRFLKRYSYTFAMFLSWILSEYFRIRHHHHTAFIVITGEVLTLNDWQIYDAIASFSFGIAPKSLKKWIISLNLRHHWLQDTALCFLSTPKKENKCY